MKTFQQIHDSMFSEIYKSPEGWPEGLAQVDLFERAAKEYAKQWVEKSAIIADESNLTGAPLRYEIHKLKKEIDAQ